MTNHNFLNKKDYLMHQNASLPYYAIIHLLNLGFTLPDIIILARLVYLLDVQPVAILLVADSSVAD
jgi:hypothetical protein